MEPQIRYAKTSDGVSIAYTTWGAGSGKPPMIAIGSHPFSDMQVFETFQPKLHACLVRHWSVTRYDGRGTGRSQRDVSDFSLEAKMRDVEAVVAAVGTPRVALMAEGWCARVGLAYAAAHPDQVDKLITYIGGPAGEASPNRLAPSDPAKDAAENRGFLALASADWGLFLDAFASRTMVWSDAKSRDFADLLRTNLTQEVAFAYYEAGLNEDVSDRLHLIQAATLVLLQRSSALDDVQRFISTIPNATLVSFDTTAMWLPEQAVVDAIEAFMGSATDSTTGGDEPSSTAVILFTDIVDSTALTERMGDAAFRAASRRVDEGIRRAIRDAGGTAVEGKVLGDGIMGIFASAAQGIRSARACVELSGQSELRLHVGLHAGDVLREEGNVYGGAVNIAARICGLSAPGEILVSDVVRGMARSSAGVEFADRGEHALKGIEDAVRLYEVRWRE